ncbi:lipopolysaccharide biosynthesis protein [Glaciimonas sp. Gout2]|uniref:lipopolysaccharide biosynthesis protein n=2 Tax=Glaciimonas TaxID=1229970 RepID=UPI002AB45B6E|nr:MULTISPECIES: lipopolysaccharide biosynthesis protein [unclassified Glaciimonas]MDY7548958.1 lipopolysaccharide biosynthesis protein [Glaciimonas sp. CA11.2]MEB0013657.1 lipopolysaccharide biosynthesis protein [Glaciimonas sp. Cout2]MEB0083683.1 lipopolysaccharide biosynthesis protein [Glaciimonas sp. Gout2]
MEMGAIKQKKAGGVASGSIWSIVDNLAQQILSFVIFAVLARFLAPDAFGLLTVAHLFILFTRLVVFDAIAMPIVRTKEPNDRLYSWVFTCCTLAGLILAGLMFFSAGVVSSLFRAPDLKTVLQGMSASVLFYGLVRAYEARLVRNMMFRQLAIRSILSVSIGGVVGITLATKGWGGMSLVVQQVTASGLGLALVVAQSRWLPRLVFDRALMRRYWDDVRQVGMSGVLSFANTNGDSLLVSIFLGPYATGLYNLAKRVTSAVYLVIASSMHKVALPVFSNAGTDLAALRKGYLKILGITFFCVAPLLCFQAVLAKPLITAVFGAKWLPAAPTIGALAILYLLSSITQLNDYLFFAMGKNRIPVMVGIAQLMLATALSAAFYHFGLIGMSLSFCGAFLLVFPISQTLLNRALGLDVRMMWFALAPPLVGSIILFLGLGAYLLMMPPHFTDVTLVAGGVMIVCLLYPFIVAITGWKIRAVNSSWHEMLLAALRFRRFFVR